MLSLRLAPSNGRESPEKVLRYVQATKKPPFLREVSQICPADVPGAGLEPAQPFLAKGF